MEQPIPDQNRRYTLEEYFALDGVTEIKYEYWDGLLVPHGGWETDKDGKIIGMAGGTGAHSDVACNLIRELGIALRGKPCKVGSSDLRVKSPRTARYHYPDVSVTCGPRVFDPPEKQVTLVNPRVIIEVTSPSTANFDRGEKFREYLAIESLREYVLVSQDQPRVDVFYRSDEGTWIVGPWGDGMDASANFPSLGVTIPLSEIYSGVEFPTPEKPTA